MTKQKGTYIFETSEPVTKKNSDTFIITTVTSKKEFKEFYDFAFEIYQDDPHWVAPLWKEMVSFFKIDSPFWNHSESCLFLAYKDGKIVGRIAAIIDQLLIKKENEQVAYFGFFEVIDDYNIAKELFEIAREWLKNKNIEKMRGPIDGRIDMRCGLLLNGFDETPFIFASYNPKYYVDFVEKYGMKKCRDQLVYHLDLSQDIPQYLKDAAEKVEKMNIKIRGFDRLHAGRELKWWIPMMMKTFSFHWGYVDVPKDEVMTRFGVKQMRWIADPGLFLIAESPEGEPISFKWTTPDFNQAIKELHGNFGLLGYLKFFYHRHKINRGRLNFVGVKKEWQGKSIGSAMNYWTLLEMKKRGYSGAECGWIDEKNIASQRTIEKTGAKLNKKYRVYEIST